VDGVFSQNRAISNAMEEQLSSRKIMKDNLVKTQYIAVVPSKKSSFMDGSLVKISHFDSTGKVSSVSEYEAYADSTNTTYTYFDDGYLSYVKTRASEDNVLIVKYSYDSLGRVTKIYHSGSDRKDFECFYDQEGNLIKKLGYQYYPKLDKRGKPLSNDSDMVLVDEIELKYNKSNKLVNENVKINGKLISKTTYKYNKDFQKTEEKAKYLGNTITYKYEYDDNMLLKSFVRYNINGTKSYFKVEYEYFR